MLEQPRKSGGRVVSLVLVSHGGTLLLRFIFTCTTFPIVRSSSYCFRKALKPYSGVELIPCPRFEIFCLNYIKCSQFNY